MNKLPKYLSYRNDILYYNDINLLELVQKQGDCLEVCCPLNVKNQIEYLKKLFDNSIKNNNYKSSYYYAYATKSNYDKEIIIEAIKYADYIETSSKNDLGIFEYLYNSKIISNNIKIICNGFKDKEYFERIINLYNNGFDIIPVLENLSEIDYLINQNISIKIGIRINIDKEKNMFYGTNDCTRFGIYYKDFIKIIKRIKNSKLELSLFHFHLNGGVDKTEEFKSFLEYIFNNYYVPLKRKINTLNIFDIGGGLVIDNYKEFNYENYVNNIIKNIKKLSIMNNIEMPNIISENGTYTVADSRFNIYKVEYKKKIKNNCYWYILNNSIASTLPDSWILGKEFLVLPINLIKNKYVNVRLSSLTCDYMDEYYYQENKEYLKLPKLSDSETLYIGFFKTGAYQGILSGKNTIHHCLIEEPKKILIKDKIEVIKEKQSNDDILKILNYK